MIALASGSASTTADRDDPIDPQWDQPPAPPITSGAPNLSLVRANARLLIWLYR
jgi:hypothetical protein